jgi:hypothetical protein
VKDRKAKEKLYRAIEEYLRQINEKKSPQTHLAFYPESKGEIRSYLETVSKVRRAFQQVEIPVGLEERGLNRVLAELQLLKKSYKANFLVRLKERVAVWPQSKPKIAVGFLTVVMVMVLVMSGLVYASSRSLPGSFLYPIKRLIEDVQLAFTFDEYGKAQLYTQLARRRAQEAKKLEGKDKEGAQKVAREGLRAYRQAAKLFKKLGKGKVQIAELAWLEELGQKLAKGEVVEQARESKLTSLEEKEAKIATELGSKKQEVGGQKKDTKNLQTFSASEKEIRSKRDANLVGKVKKSRDRREQENINNRALASEAVGATSKSNEVPQRKIAEVKEFRIKKLRLSNIYLSPDGDGVNDSVVITVELNSDIKPYVKIVRDGRQIARLDGDKVSKTSFKFEWWGQADIGKVSDGNYLVEVADKSGRVAKQKARIIVDTKPPEVSLIEPPPGITVTKRSFRFVWQASEDAEFYSISLNPVSATVGAMNFSGLKNSFFVLPQDSVLFSGTWSWRVVAVDRAGNVGSSSWRSFYARLDY